MGRIARLAGALLILAGSVALARNGAEAFLHHYTSAVDASDRREVVLEIPAGSDPLHIGRLLAAEGLIRHPLAFRLAVRYTGQDARLQAGEYAFRRSESLWEIIDRIAQGKILLHPFTVPEGLTVEEVADRLDEQGIAPREALLERFSDPSPVAAWLPPDARAKVRYPLEGYLYPETYRVPRSITPDEVVALLVSGWRARLTPEVLRAAAEKGLDAHDLLTLASIVEREARVAEERPHIAAVFLNRLERGMPLQADPTVRYALRRWEGPVLYRDLEFDSPYNTYRHPGLPPGPIANPGWAAVEAVLHPAPTEDLFFVARPDGTHAFARTFAAHLENVRRYQAQGR